MEQKEALEIFRNTNALLEGHFLLTSGKHSDRYFQCARAIQYPEYNRRFAGEIVKYFREEEIDVVLSPAIGGIVIGQEVARQLSVRFIFTEREDGKMTLRRGFELAPGEKVLIVEDVVTTGGSVYETIDVVKNSFADVVGVGMIVDRSGGKVLFGVPQVSVIQMEVQTYDSEHCPQCKLNIPIVKPGSRKFGNV